MAAHPRCQRAAALRAVANGKPVGGHAHCAANRLCSQPSRPCRGHPEEEVFLTVASAPAGLDIYPFLPLGCGKEEAAAPMYTFSRLAPLPQMRGMLRGPGSGAHYGADILPPDWSVRTGALTQVGLY